MSRVLTEGQHKGEFLVSEANGTLSREEAVLTSGQVAGDGRVLKFVAGKLVVATGSHHSDGTSDEDIAGICYGNYDASASGANADVKGCVYISRVAEYKTALVTLHAVTGGGAAAATAAVLGALRARHLIGR